MIYYLFGNENYLIDQKIQEIISQNPENLILKFNSEVKINDVINQISTFSLFDTNKILIFNNFPFLLKANENEKEAIIDALNFKPNSTLVIFTSEKINEKTKYNDLLNFLKSKAICFEYNELSDKEIAIEAREKINKLGASISEIDLFYFLSKIPNKLSIVMQEIEKLVSLDLNISRTNIDDLVQKYDLSSAFDFINSFHDRNIELLFKTYYEKLAQGETIQNFINQITNVLEICSRIYSLKKLNYDDKKISETLNKHIFVVKKNSQFLNAIGYLKIQKYLDLICEIDSKIKSGVLDDRIGFERFLLETLIN